MSDILNFSISVYPTTASAKHIINQLVFLSVYFIYYKLYVFISLFMRPFKMCETVTFFFQDVSMINAWKIESHYSFERNYNKLCVTYYIAATTLTMFYVLCDTGRAIHILKDDNLSTKR